MSPDSFFSNHHCSMENVPSKTNRFLCNMVMFQFTKPMWQAMMFFFIYIYTVVMYLYTYDTAFFWWVCNENAYANRIQHYCADQDLCARPYHPLKIISYMYTVGQMGNWTLYILYNPGINPRKMCLFSSSTLIVSHRVSNMIICSCSESGGMHLFLKGWRNNW